MKFLLLGRGSAGKRHESILLDLGHTVTTIDPAPGAEADYQSVVKMSYYVRYDEIAGVLICTPSNVRNEPVRDVNGLPILDNENWFIEKPLGELSDIIKAQLRDEHVQVGFCYRYLPSLEVFIAELASVQVFSLLLVSGQWLPDWHDDDYRRHYHGTPGRGGVVLDSLPHSLFIARWILGDVRYVGSVTAKLSGLDLHTEDTAAVLLEAPTGQPVYILADYLRRPRTFYIEAVTSGGVRRWEFDLDEADAMYRRQMEVFVEVASGKRRYGYPDLAEGVAVQRLLEQCLKREAREQC